LQQFRSARRCGVDQSKTNAADDDRQRIKAEIRSKVRANSQRIDVSCYLIGEIMASISLICWGAPKSSVRCPLIEMTNP
jgi:hypothetical protein